MIRLLADEHFPFAAIKALRRIVPQAEIATTYDLEVDGTPDNQLLEFAALHNWCILSFDKRTLIPEAIRRIRDGDRMGGAVWVHPDASHRIVRQDLVIIASCLEQHDVVGRIIHVPLQ